MSIDWSQLLTEAELNAEKVPESIKRWQGTLQMKREGLWGDVEKAFNYLPPGSQKDNAEAALYHTETWQRSSPTLIFMADHLGITKEQLDEMFIAASKIEV